MSMTKSRFFHAIQVRYADTDAQGHVFFANYLTYFDEAMGAYFRAIDIPWDKMEEMGRDIVHASVQCDFKGSARYAEILHVHAAMARIGNTSLTFECEIYKSGGDELIADGSITAVVVDAQTWKPARVPDLIREKVAAFKGVAGMEQGGANATS